MWAQWLWFQGSGAQAQYLRRMGLVSPWHVGSPRIKDWIRVSCLSRQILYHWAARETPESAINLERTQKVPEFSPCVKWGWIQSVFKLHCGVLVLPWRTARERIGDQQAFQHLPVFYQSCLAFILLVFFVWVRVLPKKFNNYLLRSSLSFFQFKSLCFCNKHTVFPYYYFKRKTKILKFWG